MRRTRSWFAVIALALAALLPLEQAHCLWMSPSGSGASCAPTMTQPEHGCCAPASKPAPPKTLSCCVDLPPGTLPVAAVPAAFPAAQTLAVLQVVETTVTATQAVRAPIPATDVGSPPLPIVRDAHGLRAPPLSV